MATEHEPTTLRIGVFFDGTGNNRSNAVKGDEPVPEQATGSYASALSNIALLYDAYPVARGFLSLYVEGPGTLQGKPDSDIGWYTGSGGTGVRQRLGQAALALAAKLQAWRQSHPSVQLQALKFDLFGFSRGAAGARAFANDLGKGTQSLLAQACDFSPCLGWEQGVAIDFIGLFDTVGAIVEPLKFNFTSTNGDYGQLHLALAPGVAGKVIQLVAADEHRYNYPLVATGNDLRLPGAHADLGGGYLQVSREKIDLSRVQTSDLNADADPLDSEAYAAALALAADYTDVPGLTPQLRVWEARAGLLGQRKTVNAVLHREREVHGHLSRVYLRIMHALAVDSQVPMQPLSAPSPGWELPQDLLVIAGKLEDFALGRSSEIGLTETERHLLHRKYVHTTANWEAFTACGFLPDDLVYLNRPADEGRLVEPNV